MAKKQRIPHKFQPWIDARKLFQLSDAQIQMARELGLSPKRFANYADRKDEPWKLSLPKFIESLYAKQFGKTRPDHVQSMEEIAAAHVAKRAARKAEKENRFAAGAEVGQLVADGLDEQSRVNADIDSGDIDSGDIDSGDIDSEEIDSEEIDSEEIDSEDVSEVGGT